MKKNLMLYILTLFVMIIGINDVGAVAGKATSNDGRRHVTGIASSDVCKTPLISAECTYSWTEYDVRSAANVTKSVVVKYSNGLLSIVNGGDLKKLSNEIDPAKFMSLSSEEKKCPSSIYGVATGYNVASQSSVVTYYDSEDKAKAASANPSEIALSNSSLECGESDDVTPISQGRTILNGYIYNCDNNKTKIYEYTDGTVSVTSDIAGVSFASDYKLSETISNMLNNHNYVYLVKTSYSSSYDSGVLWGLYDSAQQSYSSRAGVSYTNYKCDYVEATTEIAGENASVDENANRHAAPRGEDSEGTDVSNDCKGLLGTNTLEFLKQILNVIMIVGPIIAVVLGTYELIAAMASGDDDAKKKGIKKLQNRLIAVALLLLVPYIVKLILNIVGRGSDCL